MNKQRLLELAGISEANQAGAAGHVEEMINFFLRYAAANWEDDVWRDAVEDLVWRLYASNPKEAQRFVEGNLEEVDPDDYPSQDQIGIPVGNRFNWK